MKKILLLLPLLLVTGCSTTQVTPTISVDTWTNIVSPQVVVQTWATDNASPSVKPSDDATAKAGDYRIITVNAERWRFTPSEIKVKKWEKVKLKINNIDTTHDAKFATMQVTVDADGLITLDTSTVGSFPFKCATFCGEGHQQMTGVVVVA